MADALLFEVGVMLAAIAAAGFVATRLSVSSIPLYILAGMALNRYVIGRLGLPSVHASDFVTVGAELGIVLLLFFLGLEFNLERLLADRRRIGVAGVVDFVLNFSVGLAFGYLLFGNLLAAMLVAGIVYVSSSAIVTKTLLDLGWIANPESAPLLGVLVFEDLVVAGYLALVSALLFGGGSLGQVARSLGTAFGFILLLLVLVAAGTVALERLLETPSAEHFVLRALGVTVFVAGAALVAGVSEAVAAFFVGMAFSATSYAHQLEVSLSPVRDTFAAVFFFWIGLVTDPLAVLDVLGPVLAAVLVTTPTKVVSGFSGGRVYALDDRRSLRVGLAMVTRGEFSLVLGSVALAGVGAGATGVLTAATAETIAAFAVGYVLLMSVLGTLLMQESGRFERLVGHS